MDKERGGATGWEIQRWSQKPGIQSETWGEGEGRQGRGYRDCPDDNAVERGGCREGLIDCLKLMLGSHTQPVSKVLVRFTFYLTTERSP